MDSSSCAPFFIRPTKKSILASALFSKLSFHNEFKNNGLLIFQHIGFTTQVASFRVVTKVENDLFALVENMHNVGTPYFGSFQFPPSFEQ